MAIKMVATVWRKPGLSLEAFTARWVKHGALVAKHKEAMGFVRYVQCHTVPSPEIEAFAASRGWVTPPDGVAELYWEDEAALKRTFESEAAGQASAILAEDEAIFVDTTRTSAFLARENQVFDDR